MNGRAMLAMVLSSTTISWAIEMITSAQRRRRRSVASTSGGDAAMSVMTCPSMC